MIDISLNDEALIASTIAVTLEKSQKEE